jgi:hypothetical protein
MNLLEDIRPSDLLNVGINVWRIANNGNGAGPDRT